MSLISLIFGHDASQPPAPLTSMKKQGYLAAALILALSGSTALQAIALDNPHIGAAAQVAQADQVAAFQAAMAHVAADSTAAPDS